MNRQFLSQMVIIGAVCGGGWMMFVEPAVNDIHQIEELMAASGSAGGAAQGGSIEAVAARLAAASGRLKEVAARNEVAEDSSKLYATIMTQAGIHGVDVKRLQPSPGTGGEAAGLKSTKLSILMEGSFDQVAAFLEGVQNLEGYMRPESLQLTAITREGEAAISAQFSLEVIEFQIPPALLAMETEATDEP